MTARRFRAALVALARCAWSCNNCGTYNDPNASVCRVCARRG